MLYNSHDNNDLLNACNKADYIISSEKALLEKARKNVLNSVKLLAATILGAMLLMIITSYLYN